MMRNMRRGVPNLFKQGTQHLSGLDQAVLKNLQACKELTEITRTSLGPNGMNKMIINHLGKLFVTSDAATIMQEMEIQHPAAKLIVLASQMQEKEVGDGSNFVVCLAGELLGKAAELINMGLHPSEIVAGYDKAAKHCLALLETLVEEAAEDIDMSNREILMRGLKSAVAAKQYGYEEFLSGLIADACLTVMPVNRNNFNVDNVRVVKLMGGNVLQSHVVKGMVIQTGTLGVLKHAKDAQIAVFTCSIAPAETETKGTVLIHNAEELVNYNLSEEKAMDETLKAIADSGVNVIVTGEAVDELALHFCEKYGMMVIKLKSKFQLRRLCRATKARPIVTLGPVAKEHQGFCSAVDVVEYGGNKVTIFAQNDGDDTAVATVVLRASTNNILNDVERAIDDGVNVVRAMGRDGRFVAGAGAIDIELARLLDKFASKTVGLDQYALKKFAEAFEVVPRILSENAGLDPTKEISVLYAAHENGQRSAGLNIEGGGVIDSAGAGILDLMSAKYQAIKLATDAAITILRVDQIIVAKQAGGPKTGNKQGNWDE